MLTEREIDIIKRKFKTLIIQRRISKPKHNKKEFFKKKAESSLILAKELLAEKECSARSAEFNYSNLNFLFLES